MIIESHQLNVWTTALDLPEYEVVDFEQRDGLRHFTLVPTYPFAICPECSRTCQNWHQKRWLEEIVDLPQGDYAVRLKVRVFQFHCEDCEKHWTPPPQFLAAGSGAKVTWRFLERASELIPHSSISRVAEFYGIPRKTLERWYYDWQDLKTQQQEEEDALEPIRALGVDELSLKKRHRQYVLVIIDHTNRRVLDVLESREKARLKAFFEAGLQSGLFAEVAEVTTDMWEAYGNAAREVFGDQVRVTIDRFHVMKNLQDQLTKARREIQRNLPDAAREALKGSRWLWLKNAETLTPEEAQTLEELCREYPRLGRLRAQRDSLRTLFEDQSVTTAWRGRQRLKNWLKEARSLNLKALNRFCQTLENWLTPIANYFVNRLSNGPTEGFNNAFRSLLYRAFGMRNFDNFRTRVLHIFGKPQPQLSPEMA